MKQYSSIFNDVLGPVMCGLSSSHTAAPSRIGNIARQIAGGDLRRVTAYFDPEGTVAPGIVTQNTDVGLIGGIMGIPVDDVAMFESLEMARAQGVEIEFKVEPFPNNHQNTFFLELENSAGKVTSIKAISWGGGTIEITDINGFPVSVGGGFHENFAFYEDHSAESQQFTNESIESAVDIPCIVETIRNDKGILYHISTKSALDQDALHNIFSDAKERFTCAPVFPIASQIVPEVPFRNYREMLVYAQSLYDGVELWELAVKYEAVRSGQDEDAVYDRMKDLVHVFRQSLAHGLEGTSHEKRILGAQSKYFEDDGKRARLIQDEYMNTMIRYISAIMEAHSSEGLIVAAPTSGACGTLPGAILSIADVAGKAEADVIKAFFAAGLIGVFISEESTFAAEIMGCQAEAGSASGMAAAGLVQLMGGTLQEACDAAAMALQNVFGMTCESVCMGVEVPCLGKNIMAATNAFAMANMALIGYDVVVPFDETLDKFDTVGRMIPKPVRCTGREGLSQTPTSLRIKKELFDQ